MPLGPAAKAAVDAKQAEIMAHAKNTSGPNALSVALVRGAFAQHKRLFIPHDTVDVLELYMDSVFEAEGNVPHYIDDWCAFHVVMGEVHCGTNVMRRPPELDPGFTDHWWKSYQPELDLDYDPAG
jgi:hypothetical protein